MRVRIAYHYDPVFKFGYTLVNRETDEILDKDNWFATMKEAWKYGCGKYDECGPIKD